MDRSAYLRIGVDVGGTNTDAALLDVSQSSAPGRGVIAFHKTATTSPDVTDGIESAVRAVLQKSGIPSERVSNLTIGTTHFLNAVIESDERRLSRVAVVRLSTSYTRDIPPFSDFPPSLKNIIHGHFGFVNGGLHIDGSEESAVVKEQVIRVCEEIRERRIDTVVINGVFSPIDMNFRQEKQVQDVIMEQIPFADVVCASDVANLGFLERENAAILNASILRFARRTIKGFRAAMKRLHLTCPLYLTQNDGTLIDAASAARLPIRTFSSGATNSMRGAAYLGLAAMDGPAIVVDIGGTTSDVGYLLSSGYPRQASAFTTVAGVRINYTMPHVESVGLGGGSVISDDGKGGLIVGPNSVGYRLTKEAKVFGGNVLTATDLAVAHDPNLQIGDATLIEDVPAETIRKSQEIIKSRLERLVDVMKTSPEPLPVLLVGGGSTIAPDSLDGVSRIICPPFHQVANAVGAATSKVGSTVDIVQSTEKQTEVQALEFAVRLATQKAVASGAAPDSIVVTEKDSIPLQYMNHQVRTMVRVVGELSCMQSREIALDDEAYEEVEEEVTNGFHSVVPMAKSNGTIESWLPQTVQEIDTYLPLITRNKKTGTDEWIVSEIDLIWLAEGCYILGCAGGGTPRPEFLKLRDQVRNGHRIRIVEASSLPKDACVYWGGNMGSPQVSAERLSGPEMIESIREMMYYERRESFDAVMAIEIGGSNGLQPLLWGSSKNFDRPVVDADWMGRAYPNYWQNTLTVHESGQIVPCAICSGNGKAVLMTRTDEDLDVDRVLRASCVEMGSYVGMCGKPTTADRVVNCAVLNTYSLAWRMGRVIHRARLNSTMGSVSAQLIDELGGPSAAKLLFRGKITGVARKLLKGHSYGEVIVEHLADDTSATSTTTADCKPLAQGGHLHVPFRNENIYAKHVSPDGIEKVIATVPDLIAIVDTQTGHALGVPEFRYGAVVLVLGIVASPRWTDTARGLQIGGPGSFGLDDLEHRSLGAYVKPRSVIEQFAPKADSLAEG